MPIASSGCVPVLLLTKWLLIRGSPDTFLGIVLTGFREPVFLTSCQFIIRTLEDTNQQPVGKEIEWDAEQRTFILVAFRVQHGGRCKHFWLTNLQVLQTPTFGTSMEVSLHRHDWSNQHSLATGLNLLPRGGGTGGKEDLKSPPSNHKAGSTGKEPPF